MTDGIERRRLHGLLFLALAGLLAWGGTVDPAKASIRWVLVAALVCWGLVEMFFDRIPWLRERDRVERVYLQMISLGLAIAAVAWLIPANGSEALLGVGVLLVIVPLGLWIRLWYVRRQAKE
ncbi:MAG TPA: hypothetical protein VGJ80_01945 [Gemmatimonadales bacterium]|jgi:thiosulfate reductase cytochrome b subunit